MSVRVDLPPEHWLGRVAGDGEPDGHLRVQVAQVTRSDEPGWVWVHTWKFASVLAEMPDLVRYLVRWDALPEAAQRMLVERGQDDHAQP